MVHKKTDEQKILGVIENSRQPYGVLTLHKISKLITITRQRVYIHRVPPLFQH